MSLRRGTLEEYYNSGPGARSAGCKVTPGVKPTCYEDEIEPNITEKLQDYAKYLDQQ
jgi:hypothetical protein